MSGQPMRLRPRAAASLAIALDELTANAGQLGALSSPEGRLRKPVKYNELWTALSRLKGPEPGETRH